MSTPQKRVGGKRTLSQLMGLAIATVAARLLARPILQEYDAFTVELAMNPALVQSVEVASWKEADACTMDWISNCYGSY